MFQNQVEWYVPLPVTEVHFAGFALLCLCGKKANDEGIINVMRLCVNVISAALREFGCCALLL